MNRFIDTCNSCVMRSVADFALRLDSIFLSRVKMALASHDPGWLRSPCNYFRKCFCRPNCYSCGGGSILFSRRSERSYFVFKCHSEAVLLSTILLISDQTVRSFLVTSSWYKRRNSISVCSCSLFLCRRKPGSFL